MSHLSPKSYSDKIKESVDLYDKQGVLKIYTLLRNSTGLHEEYLTTVFNCVHVTKCLTTILRVKNGKKCDKICFCLHINLSYNILCMRFRARRISGTVHIRLKIANKIHSTRETFLSLVLHELLISCIL